jgi:NAD(P)-dependent dehydrogenase (short-subunit alcohol dehydrogenase family)
VDRSQDVKVVITGSAGGIGRATRARLEADGAQVIGVDVRDAEVIADLATPAGRSAMVEGVTAACDGQLDGLVAAAGVTHDDGRLVTAVNYFGAIATLEGLRPLLAGRPGASAVAVSSNSTTTQPGLPVELAEACLTGDEAAALSLSGPGVAAYPATKLALARWVRRQAVTEGWIGAGIRLNAIAPGLIATPMTAGIEEMVLGLGDVFPIPIARAGRAEEVAGLLAYLLGPDAGFFVGSFLVMDGGTDATVRAEDWPRPL